MTKKTTAVKKSAKQKVVKVENQDDQGNMVQTLITQAIDKNVPVETLERLLAMRDKLKAESAKEAFDRDMASFQGECPSIKKTKQVKSKNGALLYCYAPIDSIVIQVKPFLNLYNFSYAITTETLEGKVKATCKAKHTLGHSEESSMEVPLGAQTGIMSPTQVVASALTFAKRYAFCNTFGIMTSDQDDDAKSVPKTEDKKPVKVNYLDLLKTALYKQGAKNAVEAVEVFNRSTGMSIKALPTANNDRAHDLYDNLLSTPTYEDIQ